MRDPYFDMVGVTGSIPVAPTIYSYLSVFCAAILGSKRTEIVDLERIRPTAQIVWRRLPGPNVKHERCQHRAETHGGGGQDCGEAQPWRADAEIRGKLLAV